MKKALVTGGGGFLGSRIVRMLLDQGIAIRSLQRSDSPELKKLGVEIIRGDISDRATVINAAEGCDVIFHVAAKAGVWGDYDDYYQCNVTGTKNIIDACQTHHIQKLIYTSSPSVVFAGKDEENINESTPYPDQFLTAYQKTKALAEQMVLEANNETLATVALRPHLIWGPGDPHLVPRIIERAKAGRLRLVGKQSNLVDSTHIDNAALAHILAAEALAANADCAGKTYFISNDEPLPMKELINKILAAANLPAITKTIPTQLAYTIGMMMELVYKIFKLKDEPIMTRFIAKQLSCAHWYDLTAAKNDLGYQVKVTINEGMERLKASLNK
ncbi:MAG: NAD-dependent epimerase/dehydratase family protein [Proteobacteria bacterium]|nr:NAD-dependent epimerase/dehydratase family protein [Pseudomonadota bacterium]